MIRRITITAYLLIMVLSAAVSALADELPDSPAGKLMTDLIATFNSGDEEQWISFINNRWIEREGAFEGRLNFFHQLSDGLGKLEFQGVKEQTKYSISALYKASNPDAMNEWVLLAVYVDSLSGDKVDRLDLRPADEPGFEVPEGDLTDEDIVEFLERYLDNLESKDRFSGTVLIARDGIPIYSRSAGLACKRYDVPNRLDTKFNLGSMNKMFTGVAIMQLVERGQIQLDVPVGTYLPDIPRREIRDKVTVRHLLSHTSGMQDYWDEIFSKPFWKIKTVAQMGELIFDDSLLFEPGTDFHYSNSGPILLGMIIEKVTGQDYYDYIRENICKPAGMINTECYEVDRPIPNLAIGYTKSNYEGEITSDGWRNNLFMHVVKGGPAGGGYSTVEDLLKFDIALRNNVLIIKALFDTLTTGKTPMGPDESYAFLFSDRNVKGQRVIGHGGGAPGINAKLDMYMDSGYTVAVLANYDMAAERVAGKIEELLAK
jgi:CubicO group peptidase (beta-lactamase class C family)